MKYSLFFKGNLNFHCNKMKKKIEIFSFDRVYKIGPNSN